MLSIAYVGRRLGGFLPDRLKRGRLARALSRLRRPAEVARAVDAVAALDVGPAMDALRRGHRPCGLAGPCDLHALEGDDALAAPERSPVERFRRAALA